MSEEDNLVDAQLSANFKPLKTIIPITVQLLFASALEITSIVLAIRESLESSVCLSYFIVLYLQGAHWFVALIIDHILKYRHHELRMNGYLEFYKSTLNHHRLPFYVVSLWTATLFILQTLMQHFYLDNLTKHCMRHDLYTPLKYNCAILSVEYVVLVAIIVSYISKVYRFNKLKPLPDVQKEEWALGSTSHHFVQGEIGYGIQGSRVEDLLEKQADLIQYLKEHNSRMNEKMMIMSAQLRSRGIGDRL